MAGPAQQMNTNTKHCDRDPEYYLYGTRLSQKMRYDGKCHQCFEPGCLYSEKDLCMYTMPSHSIKYHGYTKQNVPSMEERRRRVTLIDEPTHKTQRPRWLEQRKTMDAAITQNGNAPLSRQQLLAALTAVAPINALVQHTTAVNPVQAIIQPPQSNPAVRTILTRWTCYICSKTYSSRKAVAHHALVQHERSFIQEPFQPGRVAKVEYNALTGQPLKLVDTRHAQLPTMLGICVELRESILQRVPTDFRVSRCIDRNIFKALAINKTIRQEALTLFPKFNFLIRVNVYSFFTHQLDFFDQSTIDRLPTVPIEVAQRVGTPALTIDIDLVKGNCPQGTRRRGRFITLVYNESWFTSLLIMIQNCMTTAGEIRISFAPYASHPRYSGTEKTFDMSFGFLRYVPRVIWSDAGQWLRNDTTRKKQQVMTEIADATSHLLELVMTLDEQLDRGMLGPASMTGEWLEQNDITHTANLLSRTDIFDHGLL